MESLPPPGLPLNLALDERDLTLLYGLTRMEAALAAKLVRGKSLNDAAGELSISPQAARTHLKRIVMKTYGAHPDRPMRDRIPTLQG